MAKAVAVSWTLFALACSSEPFVIGQYVAPDAYVPAADAAAEADAASASDGGADAGPVERLGECTTTYPRALACSQFEDADVAEGWDQLVQTGDSLIERTEARSHSGDGALRATTSEATKRAAVVRKFDALYEGELFIRAYLYVPAAVPTRVMNVFFVGDDRSNEYEDEGVDFNLADGALQAYLSQDSPDRYTGELQIPRDRWFCFRARLVLHDESGSVEAHADDALLLEISGLDTVPERGVRHFRAGIDWSSEQEEFFEVFMDDLVFARTPVPCW